MYQSMGGGRKEMDTGRKSVTGTYDPSGRKSRIPAAYPVTMLVDLQVYVVPREKWVLSRRLYRHNIVEDGLSLGFVRVLPQLSIHNLRRELQLQLGPDVIPRDFIFIRAVGNIFIQLKPKQEIELKVKNFIPPFSTEPEIYLLEVLPNEDPRMMSPLPLLLREDTPPHICHDLCHHSLARKLQVVKRDTDSPQPTTPFPPPSVTPSFAPSPYTTTEYNEILEEYHRHVSEDGEEITQSRVDIAARQAAYDYDQEFDSPILSPQKQTSFDFNDASEVEEFQEIISRTSGKVTTESASSADTVRTVIRSNIKQDAAESQAHTGASTEDHSRGDDELKESQETEHETEISHGDGNEAILSSELHTEDAVIIEQQEKAYITTDFDLQEAEIIDRENQNHDHISKTEAEILDDLENSVIINKLHRKDTRPHIIVTSQNEDDDNLRKSDKEKEQAEQQRHESPPQIKRKDSTSKPVLRRQSGVSQFDEKVLQQATSLDEESSSNESFKPTADKRKSIELDETHKNVINDNSSIIENHESYVSDKDKPVSSKERDYTWNDEKSLYRSSNAEADDRERHHKDSYKQIGSDSDEERQKQNRQIQRKSSNSDKEKTRVRKGSNSDEERNKGNGIIYRKDSRERGVETTYQKMSDSDEERQKHEGKQTSDLQSDTKEKHYEKIQQRNSTSDEDKKLGKTTRSRISDSDEDRKIHQGKRNSNSDQEKKMHHHTAPYKNSDSDEDETKKRETTTTRRNHSDDEEKSSERDGTVTQTKTFTDEQYSDDETLQHEETKVIQRNGSNTDEERQDHFGSRAKIERDDSSSNNKVKKYHTDESTFQNKDKDYDGTDHETSKTLRKNSCSDQENTKQNLEHKNKHTKYKSDEDSSEGPSKTYRKNQEESSETVTQRQRPNSEEEAINQQRIYGNQRKDSNAIKDYESSPQTNSFIASEGVTSKLERKSSEEGMAHQIKSHRKKSHANEADECAGQRISSDMDENFDHRYSRKASISDTEHESATQRKLSTVGECREHKTASDASKNVSEAEKKTFHFDEENETQRQQSMTNNDHELKIQRKTSLAQKVDNSNLQRRESHADKVDDSKYKRKESHTEKFDDFRRPSHAEKVDDAKAPRRPSHAEKVDDTKAPRRPSHAEKVDDFRRPSHAEKVDDFRRPSHAEKVDDTKTPRRESHAEKIDDFKAKRRESHTEKNDDFKAQKFHEPVISHRKISDEGKNSRKDSKADEDYAATFQRKGSQSHSQEDQIKAFRAKMGEGSSGESSAYNNSDKAIKKRGDDSEHVKLKSQKSIPAKENDDQTSQQKPTQNGSKSVGESIIRKDSKADDISFNMKNKEGSVVRNIPISVASPHRDSKSKDHHYNENNYHSHASESKSHGHKGKPPMYPHRMTKTTIARQALAREKRRAYVEERIQSYMRSSQYASANSLHEIQAMNDRDLLSHPAATGHSSKGTHFSETEDILRDKTQPSSRFSKLNSTAMQSLPDINSYHHYSYSSRRVPFSYHTEPPPPPQTLSAISIIKPPPPQYTHVGISTSTQSQPSPKNESDGNSRSQTSFQSESSHNSGIYVDSNPESTSNFWKNVSEQGFYYSFRVRQSGTVQMVDKAVQTGEQPQSYILDFSRKPDGRYYLQNSRPLNLGHNETHLPPISRDKILRDITETVQLRHDAELRRAELIQRANDLQSLVKEKREKINRRHEFWHKKYIEESSMTRPLEAACNSLRAELNTVHRRLIAHLEGRDLPLRLRDGPSKKANYKIMAARLQHEIKELQQKAKSAKLRLESEVKLKEQADREVRDIRNDLAHKKVVMSLARSQIPANIPRAYDPNTLLY